MVAGDVEDRNAREVGARPFDSGGTRGCVTREDDNVRVDCRRLKGRVLEVQVAEDPESHAPCDCRSEEAPKG